MRAIRWGIVVLSLFYANCLFATQTVPVNIELVSLKAKKLSEESGDEVYFTVTEYSNLRQPEHYRIPMYPTHWLSKNLDQVKNLSLWQYDLEEGESVQLILTLIEHDVPPWNVDDHLGSVKLNIKNHQGQLETKWGVPDYDDDTESTEIRPMTYTFKSPAALYEVEFKLIR